MDVNIFKYGDRGFSKKNLNCTYTRMITFITLKNVNHDRLLIRVGGESSQLSQLAVAFTPRWSLERNCLKMSLLP